MRGEAVVDRFLKLARDEGFQTAEAQARYQEYRGRRQKERDLWERWNAGGRKEEHLSPLLQSIKPLVRSEANKQLAGLAGSIPRAALESELLAAAVKSFRNYDPNRGTALSTHVVGGFRRTSDFVNANRNAKYVPGADVKRYQQYQNAKSELRDQLGRDPTPEELAPHMPGVSAKAIGRMQRSFSSELYTDLGDGVTTSDESAKLHPRDAFHLVHSQLTPQQQQFGQMFFVPEGEKQPAIRNIAQRLGITGPQAYKVKAQVEAKMGPQLQRQ